MLQADVARGGRERAVAPVAPRAAFPVVAGRLTPIMAIERDEFVLLVIVRAADDLWPIVRKETKSSGIRTIGRGSSVSLTIAGEGPTHACPPRF